jgi:hypothetical protein
MAINRKGKLMFDGVKEDVMFVDQGSETVAYTRSGRFAKFPKEFPKGSAHKSLEEAMEAHNEANKTKPEPPDENAEASQAELDAWFETSDENK